MAGVLSRFSLATATIQELKKSSNKTGYEPLNLENGSFLNSDNFDATDLRF